MIRRPPRSTLFPTRRSSDLTWKNQILTSFVRISTFRGTPCIWISILGTTRYCCDNGYPFVLLRDRKSTRLNSSHANISYAVFCLKKKKKDYKFLYPTYKINL